MCVTYVLLTKRWVQQRCRRSGVRGPDDARRHAKRPGRREREDARRKEDAGSRDRRQRRLDRQRAARRGRVRHDSRTGGRPAEQREQDPQAVCEHVRLGGRHLLRDLVDLRSQVQRRQRAGREPHAHAVRLHPDLRRRGRERVAREGPAGLVQHADAKLQGPARLQRRDPRHVRRNGQGAAGPDRKFEAQGRARPDDGREEAQPEPEDPAVDRRLDAIRPVLPDARSGEAQGVRRFDRTTAAHVEVLRRRRHRLGIPRRQGRESVARRSGEGRPAVCDADEGTAADARQAVAGNRQDLRADVGDRRGQGQDRRGELQGSHEVHGLHLRHDVRLLRCVQSDGAGPSNRAVRTGLEARHRVHDAQLDQGAARAGRRSEEARGRRGGVCARLERRARLCRRQSVHRHGDGPAQGPVGAGHPRLQEAQGGDDRAQQRRHQRLRIPLRPDGRSAVRVQQEHRRTSHVRRRALRSRQGRLRAGASAGRPVLVGNRRGQRRHPERDAQGPRPRRRRRRRCRKPSAGRKRRRRHDGDRAADGDARCVEVARPRRRQAELQVGTGRRRSAEARQCDERDRERRRAVGQTGHEVHVPRDGHSTRCPGLGIRRRDECPAETQKGRTRAARDPAFHRSGFNPRPASAKRTPALPFRYPAVTRLRAFALRFSASVR